MNALVGNVFFDTCTLWNFAVVDRLDLLEIRYGWRARWTETISFEIGEGYRCGEPRLRRVQEALWLGDPVEVDGDRRALREIDLIRQAMGGTSADPLKHLGEAEVLYHLQRREPSGIFVTDDRPALDFALRRGIFALDTSQVLAESFSQGEIGCPEAFDLIVEMAANDRGVRVPTNHMAICPT
ncbi:hypothetical protein ACFQZ8_02465 [Micromonospora azadirachtae]|uniref:PIN domain-containing protein n=1 Tax=Micromonospora azadirachtae TaxID=1970735 RepID=A0ABW2ZX17_9ACTN